MLKLSDKQAAAKVMLRLMIEFGRAKWEAAVLRTRLAQADADIEALLAAGESLLLDSANKSGDRRIRSNWIGAAAYARNNSAARKSGGGEG